eukprot:1853588-Rhodomonas_salina.1
MRRGAASDASPAPRVSESAHHRISASVHHHISVSAPPKSHTTHPIQDYTSRMPQNHAPRSLQCCCCSSHQCISASVPVLSTICCTLTPVLRTTHPQYRTPSVPHIAFPPSAHRIGSGRDHGTLRALPARDHGTFRAPTAPLRTTPA